MPFADYNYMSAGLYCDEWGLFEPTGPCQAGYYCIAGKLHTVVAGCSVLLAA